ncbi:unnamed protein product [Pieris brassicae]|uniref:Uncharacterized protein n=1 Tax=Pieris brassicae TaxID=7116 RepID=A0A9P0SGK6_PIEBR|nr:unnamed protein product [Pieris brassicae]
MFAECLYQESNTALAPTPGQGTAWAPKQKAASTQHSYTKPVPAQWRPNQPQQMHYQTKHNPITYELKNVIR